MDTALASSFCGTVTSFIRVFLLPPSQQSCEEFLSGSNKHLQTLPLSFSLSITAHIPQEALGLGHICVASSHSFTRFACFMFCTRQNMSRWSQARARYHWSTGARAPACLCAFSYFNAKANVFPTSINFALTHYAEVGLRHHFFATEVNRGLKIRIRIGI